MNTASVVKYEYLRSDNEFEKLPFADVDNFDMRVFINYEITHDKSLIARRNQIFRRNLYMVMMYVKSLHTLRFPVNEAMNKQFKRYERFSISKEYKDVVKHGSDTMVFHCMASLLQHYFIHEDGQPMDELHGKHRELAAKMVEKAFKDPGVDPEWLQWIY